MAAVLSQPGFEPVVEKKERKERGRKRKLKEGRATPIGQILEETGADAVRNDESIDERQSALGLEDDAIMLEQLQVLYQGDIDRAQFLNLVQLCRGRGTWDHLNRVAYCSILDKWVAVANFYT